MTRNPKGSVVVEGFQGRLRLRLPKFCPKRYLSLGMPDTKRNRKLAKYKAAQIEADIIFERFDSSLDKYRSPFQQSRKKIPLLEIWDAYVEEKKCDVSVTTLQIDFAMVRRRIKSCPVTLDQGDKFRAWITKKFSPGGARRVLLQLRAACNWAIANDLISTNPFAKLPKSQTSKPEIQPFTRYERDLIIESFEKSVYYNYYSPFVKFLFWSGVRTSEAIGLRWGDIDEQLEFINISESLVNGNRKDTKNHQARRFPINKAIYGLLLDIKPENPSPSEPIFKSKTGLSIDAHNFLNRAWRSVLGGLPLKYRKQYATRHTFISLCLEEGVPVAQVASWVGNSPKTIWQSYAGIVSSIPVPEP
ncbi:MAG: tyrosine-type recombinase/integrase [Symploca sp. SIO1A3]|nr:tyrosine-type recombinase/integrase [Symploca sp. SIO1A3]